MGCSSAACPGCCCTGELSLAAPVGEFSKKPLSASSPVVERCLIKVWNAVLDQVWSFAVMAVLESWASMGNCLGMSSWTTFFKVLFNMGRFTSKLQLSGNKTNFSVLKFYTSYGTLVHSFPARCQCLSPGS